MSKVFLIFELLIDLTFINSFYIYKVIRQGKLIVVAYSLRTYWAVFVNKNRCISIPLVSKEEKAFNF